MKPKHILLALLIVSAALGGFLAFLEERGLPEPEVVRLCSMSTVWVLIFAWYRVDSDIQGYKRSPFLNVGVAAFAVLAVPYYLVRSRARGSRLKAVAYFIGFFVLFIAVFTLGALPVALFS